MIEKQSYKNKIVYNNYQFYENAALNRFIDKQGAEGYSFCGAIGPFLNILKFCFTKDRKSYTIFRKHLGEEIDEEIKKIEAGNDKISYQNNLYVVFENEINREKADVMEKKQNILLSVPVKKSIAYISILLIISIISLGLKILSIEDGSLGLNFLSLGLYIALIIAFLFYFTGDLHDILAGRGIFIDGRLYFDSRTKLKDALFRMGDVFKFVILLGSVCVSIAIFLNAKNEIIIVDVFKMWVIYCISGYMSMLRFQRSYISLLIIEVFLITLTLVR